MRRGSLAGWSRGAAAAALRRQPTAPTGEQSRAPWNTLCYAVNGARGRRTGPGCCQGSPSAIRSIGLVAKGSHPMGCGRLRVAWRHPQGCCALFERECACALCRLRRPLRAYPHRHHFPRPFAPPQSLDRRGPRPAPWAPPHRRPRQPTWIAPRIDPGHGRRLRCDRGRPERRRPADDVGRLLTTPWVRTGPTPSPGAMRLGRR